MQQVPNKNSLPLRPTTEGRAEKDSSQGTREVLYFHKEKYDEEYCHRASDVSCHFVDLQLVEEAPSQFPNDSVSPQRSIYMISGPSPISGQPQSGRESVSSCECHLPGPSRRSCLYQIPGLVTDEHDNEGQIPPPTMHSTIIQPDSGEGKDEPVLPVLNNQYQNNFVVTSKVTCMLFIVTLVFLVTYVVTSIMLLLPYGLASQFCREFILINHAINPVIYSIANEGFRESCISFVQRLKEKFGL